MTFTFRPRQGGCIRAEHTTANGSPQVWLHVAGKDGGMAAVFIETDRLEEVIAGQRDEARQAGGVTSAPRRRLTEDEHEAAWDAINGLDWQASADTGLVLAAVLRALDIDPPADEALRYSADVCPGFPDHCPKIVTVTADPPTHCGGIRCGCADDAAEGAGA